MPGRNVKPISIPPLATRAMARAPPWDSLVLGCICSASPNVLLGEKLREPDFLSRLIDDYNERLTSRAASVNNEQVLTAKLSAIAEKKRRVLEAYFEGVITKEERDRAIREIDREKGTFERLLMEMVTTEKLCSKPQLEAALEPLGEWEFLEREDKRALLSLICPEIKVFRYTIQSLTLNLAAGSGDCDDVSRMRTASWRT